MRNSLFLFLLCFCCLKQILYSYDYSPFYFDDIRTQPQQFDQTNHDHQDNSQLLTNENQSDSSSHRPQEKDLAKGIQTQTGESEKTTNEKEKKEDSSSPHKLTGTVAFVSDYRSRGISQTFRQPAVQGELKYTHISGFYFKSWASNVDGTGNLLNNTSLEWDLYLGFQHALFQTQFEYNIGFLYYYYPGGRAPVPANTRYNTLEYYIALEYKKLEIKLSLTLTDAFGNDSSNPPTNWNKEKLVRPNGSSYGSPYLEANYEFSFYSKWTAAFHLGYQGITNYPQLNYVDWLISLTCEFEWFEVSVSYVQTNARKAFYKIPDKAFRPHRIDLGGPTAVIAVSKTF